MLNKTLEPAYNLSLLLIECKKKFNIKFVCFLHMNMCFIFLHEYMSLKNVVDVSFSKLRERKYEASQ